MGRLALIVLSVIMASTARAEPCLDREQGDEPTKMVEVCTKLIDWRWTRDEDRAHAYNLRGRAYNQLSYHSRAIQDFDAALRLFPGYREALANRGIAYGEMDLYDRSLADFDDLVWQFPDDPDVLGIRGVTLLRMGLYDRAIADLDRAVELDPEEPAHYSNRGAALMYGPGEYDRAERDFRRALELRPDLAIAQRNLEELGQARAFVARTGKQPPSP